MNQFHSVIRNPREKVFLVGQSAGGHAVRVAAERIGHDRQLAGIIMLSPAMPRYIMFLTKPLAKVMARYVWPLIFGGSGAITITTEEYRTLVSPLPAGLAEQDVGTPIPISLQEARELAFYPPDLKGCSCPILHLYGERDQWINPSSQRKLSEKLRSLKCNVTTRKLPRRGHLVLLSNESLGIEHFILSWVHKMPVV